MRKLENGSCYIPAYNGSLISSLTSPTLAKPLETFKDILAHSGSLGIITEKTTAAEQFMSSPINKALNRVRFDPLTRICSPSDLSIIGVQAPSTLVQLQGPW